MSEVLEEGFGAADFFCSEQIMHYTLYCMHWRIVSVTLGVTCKPVERRWEVNPVSCMFHDELFLGMCSVLWLLYVPPKPPHPPALPQTATPMRKKYFHAIPTTQQSISPTATSHKITLAVASVTGSAGLDAGAKPKKISVSIQSIQKLYCFL